MSTMKQEKVSVNKIKNMLIYAIAMKATDLMTSSRNADKQELSNFIINKIAQPFEKV